MAAVYNAEAYEDREKAKAKAGYVSPDSSSPEDDWEENQPDAEDEVEVTIEQETLDQPDLEPEGEPCEEGHSGRKKKARKSKGKKSKGKKSKAKKWKHRGRTPEADDAAPVSEDGAAPAPVKKARKVVKRRLAPGEMISDFKDTEWLKVDVTKRYWGRRPMWKAKDKARDPKHFNMRGGPGHPHPKDHAEYRVSRMPVLGASFGKALCHAGDSRRRLWRSCH